MMRVLPFVLPVLLLAVPAIADDGWEAGVDLAALVGGDHEPLGLGPAITVHAPPRGSVRVGASYEHLVFVGGDAAESAGRLDEVTLLFSVFDRFGAAARAGVEVGLGAARFAAHTDLPIFGCATCRGADGDGTSGVLSAAVFAATRAGGGLGVHAALRAAWSPRLGVVADGVDFWKPERALQLEVGATWSF